MNNEFVRQPKQLEAVKACMPLFKRRTRGETVPFEEIEEATGFIRHSSDWNLLIKHIKSDFLAECDIQIAPTYTGEYRLLTGIETIKDFAPSKEKSARKNISVATKAVSRVDDKLLSDHERRLKYARLEKLGSTHSVMSQRKALMSAILPKVES